MALVPVALQPPAGRRGAVRRPLLEQPWRPGQVAWRPQKSLPGRQAAGNQPMREQVGLNFSGIAELTGCKVATAKSRMRYALEGLRHQHVGQLAAEPSDANG